MEINGIPISDDEFSMIKTEHVEAYELKRPKTSDSKGSASRVYLPGDWNGRRVLILLLKGKGKK